MVEDTKAPPGTSLDDLVEDLDQIQDRLKNIIDRLVGVVGMEKTLLPAEYIRLSRKDLRAAMLAIADAVECLCMLPLTVKSTKKEE